MITRLRDYANARGIILLKDVTARLLTEWRSTWTFKAKSSSPAVHWAVSKTFSKWAFRTDLIEADPSAKLKSLPSEHNQVQPLTRERCSGSWQRLMTAGSRQRSLIVSRPSSCSCGGAVWRAWTPPRSGVMPSATTTT